MATLIQETFLLKDGTSNVTLRSYHPDDAELANKFSKKVAAESTHTLKYDGMPAMPIEKLIEVWNETNSHPVNLSIGVFTNDELIGNLRFFQRNPNHPWIKHIGAFGMAVSRPHWGNGIGTKMLHAMEKHARTCGIRRIEAEVRVANDQGVALYTKNGFKIEGRREKAAFINGSFHDEFYIAKLLP